MNATTFRAMWAMSRRIGTYARAIPRATAAAMTMSVMTADDIDNNEAISEPIQIDCVAFRKRGFCHLVSVKP